MTINKNALRAYTCVGALICAALCAVNFYLLQASSWDFYPNFFGANILTVDYSIFLVPVLLIISLFIKGKKRLVLMAVGILWLAFAGLVMFTAVNNENKWESQQPVMVGQLASAEQIKAAYDTKESSIIYITTVLESGRVEPESYFAYWDNLSEGSRKDRKTLYYIQEITEKRNHLSETTELIKHLNVTKLPAAIVVNTDGSKTVFEALDPNMSVTMQENESAEAFMQYLNN